MEHDLERRAVYEEFYADERLRYPAEELVRVIFPLYRDPGARGEMLTFDMGAGDGRNTVFLAENGFNVVALEGAVSGCLVAVRRLERAGLYHSGVLAGEFAELPFADGCFGLVVAWETILYGRKEQVRRYLDEALRVLRPGGRIIFTLRTPDYGPNGEEVGDGEYRVGFGGDTGSIYSAHTLEEAQELCTGMEVEAIEHYFYTLDDRRLRYDSWIIIAVKPK
ncbi:MAG: class I SAM-dependent methyltransferase [bacterium]|nr:class I SAM-dependent methyltransferase [bacterium]